MEDTSRHFGDFGGVREPCDLSIRDSPDCSISSRLLFREFLFEIRLSSGLNAELAPFLRGLVDFGNLVINDGGKSVANSGLLNSLGVRVKYGSDTGVGRKIVDGGLIVTSAHTSTPAFGQLKRKCAFKVLGCS